MTANTIIAAAALTPATPPRKNNLIPKLTITSISLLFSIALLILLLHFYVRRHVIRRARRLRPPTPASAARSPAVPPAVLNSLPVLLFSGEPKECSVCLNEFEDGEKIRSLPRCGHSFHIQCIDMWFGSHSSCPLCRAVVEEVSGEVDLCCCCRREEVVEIPAAEEVVVIDIPAGLGEEEVEEGGNLNWRRGRVLGLIWRSFMLGIWGKGVDGGVTETGPLPASLPEGPAE